MSQINDSQQKTDKDRASDSKRMLSLRVPVKTYLKRLQRFPLVKVTLISVAFVLFIASVFLNISYFMNGYLSSGQFHWVLIIGLIVVTTISLVISLWSYHARSILLKEGPALVPEKWGEIIGRLCNLWEEHHSQSQASLARVQQSSEEQRKKSDDLFDSFLTLQEALSIRDEEISRLKKGYDAKIFKKFLRRFIRIERSLCEMEHEFSGQEHQKNYTYLQANQGKDFYRDHLKGQISMKQQVNIEGGGFVAAWG